MYTPTYEQHIYQQPELKNDVPFRIILYYKFFSFVTQLNPPVQTYMNEFVYTYGIM
jgi:hypothetical protein